VPVIQDNAEYQIIRTTSAAGYADRLVYKPGTAGARTQANSADIESKARAALQANATYLALASPTNPQVVAQVNRLTRECSALIRLLLAGDLLLDNSDT
jgi:hypothetical protein